MSTTNDGAVIIKADKERYLKLGIRQIRFLESAEGLNKPMSNIFDNGASFEVIYTIFKAGLIGSSSLNDSDIEDIMDATVFNLDKGIEDLMDIVIKAGGGYFGKPDIEDEEETEVDGELQQLP